MGVCFAGGYCSPLSTPPPPLVQPGHTFCSAPAADALRQTAGYDPAPCLARRTPATGNLHSRLENKRTPKSQSHKKLPPGWKLSVLAESRPIGRRRRPAVAGRAGSATRSGQPPPKTRPTLLRRANATHSQPDSRAGKAINAKGRPPRHRSPSLWLFGGAATKGIASPRINQVGSPCPPLHSHTRPHPPAPSPHHDPGRQSIERTIKKIKKKS